MARRRRAFLTCFARSVARSVARCCSVIEAYHLNTGWLFEHLVANITQPRVHYVVAEDGPECRDSCSQSFHLLIANIVTTSKALVPSSFLLLLVRHLLLEAMHLLLVASCY